MSWAYYNEIDAYCAQWLRNLMAAGHIPAGEVDERDICGVLGDDLKGFGSCHFFAGLGGWAYAGRLAGIPDDFPLWTGSCPCQPLSSAGQRKGHADERHLWPAFHALIAERGPATVFGEQVASKDGREWLAGVRADLESMGYACGSADLPAAGVGAPHIRQRFYWVANSTSPGRCWRHSLEEGKCQKPRRSSAYLCPEPWPDHAGRGSTLTVAEVLSPNYGVPDRVAKLRAYGNAIVPQVAAEFMMASLET